MTIQHPAHPNLVPEVADAALDLQVRSHVAHAKKLQAEAIAETIVAAYDGLARAVRAAAGWLAQRRREAATRRALGACSDRTLADIGIPREQIALVARGIDHLDPDAVSRSGWWPWLAASIRRMHAARAEQLRVYRELMAYSDRDLEEIGLRRADIPTVARTA